MAVGNCNRCNCTIKFDDVQIVIDSELLCGKCVELLDYEDLKNKRDLG